MWVIIPTKPHKALMAIQTFMTASTISIIVVSIFASLWREPIQNETINPRIYDWPYDSKNFVKKYDSLQEKLEKLDGADDLLAGRQIVLYTSNRGILVLLELH